jgi:hypothetical protein
MRCKSRENRVVEPVDATVLGLERADLFLALRPRLVIQLERPRFLPRVRLRARDLQRRRGCRLDRRERGSVG